MKLVICDHPATLRRGTEYEVSRLKSALPEAEVTVHPYSEQSALLRELADADGCITGFLHLGEEVFSRCPKLKAVSIDATGYNTIDLEAARRHGVTVCAVRNYCTEEVAEHTMALMLAVARKLKVHQYRLEKDGVWAYKLAAPIYRLSGRTLAVFGFGRIGQAVAQRAQAFGLTILAVDPHLPTGVAESCGARLVSPEEAAEQADILTNHMNVSSETEAYFNDAFFQQLKRQPIFLNAGRGASVDEGALLRALDAGWISGAGLDVLQEEQPDPSSNPLFGREDVVITPHAAFYSEQSVRALQDISCDNLVAMVRGTPELANYVVSG